MTKMEALAKAEQDAIDGKITYHQLLQLRREAYAESAAQVKGAARIRVWAEQMAQAHGSASVKVWFNELSWVEALLVVRYGEAPQHWPESFSEDDVVQAEKWQTGQYVPAGVTMPARRAS